MLVRVVWHYITVVDWGPWGWSGKGCFSRHFFMLSSTSPGRASNSQHSQGGVVFSPGEGGLQSSAQVQPARTSAPTTRPRDHCMTDCRCRSVCSTLYTYSSDRGRPQCTGNDRLSGQMKVKHQLEENWRSSGTIERFSHHHSHVVSPNPEERTFIENINKTSVVPLQPLLWLLWQMQLQFPLLLFILKRTKYSQSINVTISWK